MLPSLRGSKEPCRPGAKSIGMLPNVFQISNMLWKEKTELMLKITEINARHVELIHTYLPYLLSINAQSSKFWLPLNPIKQIIPKANFLLMLDKNKKE